jgi:hypothetical protein
MSGRYSFNPVNLANAMAGLHEIGWRQSAKRCSPFKSHLREGQNWWLFKLICRAISPKAVARSVFGSVDLLFEEEEHLR